jgi:tRNA(Ile)-lysidine synthetase-like protein
MEQFYNDWIRYRYYWFNQYDGFDNYISSNYGYLIDKYNYVCDNNPIIGILIYDQLTRHYYRNENANHIITYFNRKALQIANIHNNEEFLKNLSYDDWCFFILVYRHTNERTNLLFAMKEAQKRGNKSFIKATYNRANFKEELEFYDCKNDYYNYISFDTTILDVWNEDFIYENEKDKFKVIGDYSDLITQLSIKKPNQKIIVSLSGGVDSISCLLSCVYLFTNNNVVAVHINYNNRKETNEEVKFLQWFCNKLNVSLYIRTIHEIKRQTSIENDMREVYETYTKRVRFNSYRKAHEIENKDNKEIPIVILGHNKDDCIENILTNITYKNKYDNLNGIELSMNIDNINFYRPLIDVSKKEIYEFANTYNLSYLKNSTPDWCQRGKIRTTVVPVLNNWDSRFLDGLTCMTSILKDLHLNLYMTVNNNFHNTNILTVNNLNTSILFWKYGIFKLFNFYPSNKSLQSLIQRLEQWKNSYDTREINKKTKIIIKKNLFLRLWRLKEPSLMCYEFANESDTQIKTGTKVETH